MSVPVLLLLSALSGLSFSVLVVSYEMGKTRGVTPPMVAMCSGPSVAPKDSYI